MERPVGRGDQTAAAIEDAALDLALECGFDSVTVAMIADRAGVSQRTFFNYFPTKEDAVLGRSEPQIDEGAARRFLVSKGPVLVDAIALIRLPERPGHLSRVDERMRVIGSTPTLLVRQMERIARLDHELAEIIALRLRTTVPDADVDQDAEMITHLLAGVMRAAGTIAGQGEFASPADIIVQAQDRLRRVLSLR